MESREIRMTTRGLAETGVAVRTLTEDLGAQKITLALAEPRGTRELC